MVSYGVAMGLLEHVGGLVFSGPRVGAIFGRDGASLCEIGPASAYVAPPTGVNWGCHGRRGPGPARAARARGMGFAGAGCDAQAARVLRAGEERGARRRKP